MAKRSDSGHKTDTRTPERGSRPGPDSSSVCEMPRKSARLVRPPTAVSLGLGTDGHLLLLHFGLQDAVRFTLWHRSWPGTGPRAPVAWICGEEKGSHQCDG